jgi:hypothetical protein
VRQIYENEPRFRVGEGVLSFVDGQMVEVKI